MDLPTLGRPTMATKGLAIHKPPFSISFVRQDMADRRNRMLKDGENIFLDDVTLEEASLALGVPIVPISGGGAELLEVMLR